MKLTEVIECTEKTGLPFIDKSFVLILWRGISRFVRSGSDSTSSRVAICDYPRVILPYSLKKEEQIKFP